ncbi:uncharacterized protein BT62DRAFT_878844 [Guyanagaster necrorhizus]|uniref:Uncharacterized protein n=1 Tax=Guyanagaster necrorhizus TaxID=856835 RepID=A0A9P7W5C4_9AGAR|nr:uncharacterized protein BT62DRAFT_878844 [Guyanagaster necrorhizus MCA 3950]KAG7452442.1 hypothetical protein BT62DRAFT_878844 [Guyanagaster necrorhizus MCA 3950]
MHVVAAPKHQQPAKDDNSTVLFTWSLACSALLTIASGTLVLSPWLLLFFASEHRELTSLESFLMLHLGICLFAVALALVLNALPCSVPLTCLQHSLLLPLTLCSFISSFLAYNTTDVGSLATLTSVAAGVIAIWGLWILVFGNSSSISKTTGVDKHTSSFIFGNTSSASAEKKRWKSRHS